MKDSLYEKLYVLLVCTAYLQPRLVAKEVVEVKSDEAASRITKFAWSDGKKSVSVYLDVDDAEALPEDAFDLVRLVVGVAWEEGDRAGKGRSWCQVWPWW